MARSSSGRVTKSQGKGQFWGFSSPLTIHSNALAANNVMHAAEGIIPSPPGDGSAQTARGSVIYDCIAIREVVDSKLQFIAVALTLEKFLQ